MSSPRPVPFALVFDREDDRAIVVRSGLDVGWFFPAITVAAWLTLAVVLVLFGWLVAAVMFGPFALAVTWTLTLPGTLTTRFDAEAGTLTQTWTGQFVGFREVSWPLAEVSGVELVTGQRGFQYLRARRADGRTLDLMRSAAHWDHPHTADLACIERFLAGARTEPPFST